MTLSMLRKITFAIISKVKIVIKEGFLLSNKIHKVDYKIYRINYKFILINEFLWCLKHSNRGLERKNTTKIFPFLQIFKFKQKMVKLY